MRERGKNATRRLTAAALASALGVVLLSLGSLLQVLDLSMAALASFLVVFGVIELGGCYPYLIYAVTAFLGMLLVPIKTAPLVYLAFAGYYPILKAALERYLPRFWGWVVKCAVFNLALFASLWLGRELILSEIPPEWHPYWWALFALTPIFWLYDLALTRVITAYLVRWRARLRLPKLR